MDFTERQLQLITEMIKYGVNHAFHEYNRQMDIIRKTEYDIRFIEYKLIEFGHKEVGVETLLYLKEHNYTVKSYLDRLDDLTTEFDKKNKEKYIFMSLVQLIKKYIPLYDFNTDYDLLRNPTYTFYERNIDVLRKKLINFMPENEIEAYILSIK